MKIRSIIPVTGFSQERETHTGMERFWMQTLIPLNSPT